MDEDVSLVGALVDRLASQLPYRAGPSSGPVDAHDDVYEATRATLVELSKGPAIATTLNELVKHLEDLALPYPVVSSHPQHVLIAEVRILAVMADCCNAHWNHTGGLGQATPSWAHRRSRHGLQGLPPRLDAPLVIRILETLIRLMEPIPDDCPLPVQSLLEPVSQKNIQISRAVPVEDSNANGTRLEEDPLAYHFALLDSNAKDIVEFVTASSWLSAFEFLRKAVYSIRTAALSHTQPAGSPSASTEVERAGLVALRMLSFFWVDDHKLSLIIQELCSSFLHFRRSSQITVLVVIPLLITRWIDRYPGQFVDLHQNRKRLEGGADILFDMLQTATDNVKRKALLYPAQTTLLLLLTDVFEVASNLREAKSSSMNKKILFLEALRKALKAGNAQAGYCMVCLLRAARHFHHESDAALISYAMDVQDEVRNALCEPLATRDTPADQALASAAFISLVHLSADSVEQLVEVCAGTNATNALKVAVVQACRYFIISPYADLGPRLLKAAAAFMQGQLETIVSKGLNADTHNIRHVYSHDAQETVLVINILDLLGVCPDLLLTALDPHRSYFEPLLGCVLSPIGPISQAATKVAKRLFEEQHETVIELATSTQHSFKFARQRRWSASTLFVQTLCERAVLYNDDEDHLKELNRYLESRLALLTILPSLSEVSEGVDAIAKVYGKVETTLLVSLCSPNSETCQVVTSCIGTFLQECLIADKVANSSKFTLSLLRNREIFHELASKDVRFTGLVAFQRRTQSLLRRIPHPTSAIIAAWEAAFERWLHLAKDVSSSDPNMLNHRTLVEWRNISGFLASLGGICTVSRRGLVSLDSISDDISWIDEMPSDLYEEAPLTRFLRVGVQLLACANVQVRESMREVLSNEISPVLYQPLLCAVKAELGVLFAGALASIDMSQHGEILFAEQSASLLRALMERLGAPSDHDAVSAVHLSSLTLDFAKFLDGLPETKDTFRVKIKICQLCEATIQQRENINLRDNVRIKNQLLAYIFGWMARPESPQSPEATSSSGLDGQSKVQKDLDRACLKSLSCLTFRLPLQPPEGHTDAGISERKSHMFYTYFDRFLSLLNPERNAGTIAGPTSNTLAREGDVSTSDLAITVLSNLLSANIDVGMKHSLNIGYHDSSEIRTAFIKVLYNILVQGTEFSNLTDAAISEKYKKLLELMTKDMTFAVAMSSICPASDVDELAMSLLTIFEQRGMTFELLRSLILQEVRQTENEAELLRRNSVSSKMLSLYAKWKGSSYLRETLRKVLQRLLMTSQDLNLELDPARIESQEELHKNAVQLQVVTKVFVDDICASAAFMPLEFRRICHIISTAVQTRFADAKYTAVGAFIFLRFFCPAIVAPEIEGLVSAAPSKEMRRGLLLIAKVIQNLANNVLFGAKEPFMFPLNQFLTQNIYLVTSFLREISTRPPDAAAAGTETLTGPMDFGSCVTLHRFLYEQWEHICQTLVVQEKKDRRRSPIETYSVDIGSLGPLRVLTTNLGPPTLTITWNRPSVTSNSPPSYARFQNFMLRNAFRSTESSLTTRAIYDGGESKDGLCVICVVLRHFQPESIDYDMLLYCYLKVASRLWHQPFGILIDATCYQGRDEPQDEIFKALELLAPSELRSNLNRVYVYNMNSAFKRCFRRFVRLSIRNVDSAFHPQNVEYNLIGSLQELQTHFHLKHLHLPKETISVVTDTRYMFQPVTRTSKSKGKIDIIVKVGTQYLQVTTCNKQEVYAGLHLCSIVNDIFKLNEVEEAAPNVQTADDSAFGLRSDGGKVIVYFNSPRKDEILHQLRAAKARIGKDHNAQKSFERLLRPQDVPGTLLNLAFFNMASNNLALRLSAHNLLGALCKTFGFSCAHRLVCAKELFVPLHPIAFIVSISQELARGEPGLTLDFLTEFFVGWESFDDQQKSLSIAYMAPWLSGLRVHVLANELDAEKGREKVAVILRRLIEIAVANQTLGYILAETAWPSMARDEVLMDILLEEVLKAALGCKSHVEGLDALASILVGLGSITIKAKVLSRLRKALNRTSLRPTRTLPENAIWPEICLLLRLCLALSFDDHKQAQLFLPEVFHIITMLANTGPYPIRVTVYKLLLNTVHARCADPLYDARSKDKLTSRLGMLCEGASTLRVAATIPGLESTSGYPTREHGSLLPEIETLASILSGICSDAATSEDQANAWRARWMGLVASTAFQNNAAIQPRAFTVMGLLAQEEVDDDLLYQVLVALRNSVRQFDGEGGSEMLVSIMTALSKMMTKLPPTSRYCHQLFWLAIALVRLSPAECFNSAIHFLKAVLLNIAAIGQSQSIDLVTVLMEARCQLEGAALALDDTYGIHFTEEHFYLAVGASLIRGLTKSASRKATLHVLSTLLSMTVEPLAFAEQGDAVYASSVFALIAARAVRTDELRGTFCFSFVSSDPASDTIVTRSLQNIDQSTDRSLIVLSALELVDFHLLEYRSQARTLLWLNDLARLRPAVIEHLCGSLQPLLHEVLLQGRDPETLRAAHVLLRTLQATCLSSQATAPGTSLDSWLSDIGFGGLWGCCCLESEKDVSRAQLDRTEHLIEQIIL